MNDVLSTIEHSISLTSSSMLHAAHECVVPMLARCVAIVLVLLCRRFAFLFQRTLGALVEFEIWNACSNFLMDFCEFPKLHAIKCSFGTYLSDPLPFSHWCAHFTACELCRLFYGNWLCRPNCNHLCRLVILYFSRRNNLALGRFVDCHSVRLSSRLMFERLKCILECRNFPDHFTPFVSLAENFFVFHRLLFPSRWIPRPVRFW